MNSDELNAGSSDPTDGRKQYQPLTRYPIEVKNQIHIEAAFLFIAFVVSLGFLFAIWKGWINLLCPLSVGETLTLKKYGYYSSSGMLGGIVFGMKYFYRAVARGFWHQDRMYWRFMSPFIAMAVALIVGAMIDASIMSAQRPVVNPAIVSIGFLAGYYADEAVGKMYEIATAVFGKSATTKGGDGK